MDFLTVVAAVLFFALSLAYTYACDWLKGSRS